MIRRFLVLLIPALCGLSGGTPVAAQDVPVPVQAPDSIALDFQDAELRHVISAVAAAGGFNVTFGALPNARVTLQMEHPVPRAAMRSVLRMLIEPHGLIMIEQPGMVRISPLPQTPSPAGQAQAQAERRPVKLYVYRVQHAHATELAATLRSLFGGGRTSAVPTGLSRAGLTEDLRRSQIPPAGVAAQQSVAEADDPFGTSIAGSVVADQFTNSLLVRATEEEWAAVQEALQALDIRPLQVLIEVLIAEVRRSNDFQVGLSAEMPSDRIRGSEIIAGGRIGELTTRDIVLEVMSLGNVQVDVALSLLSQRANVNVLSRPIILAQNNSEARILIGSQRPFIQLSRSLPTDAAVRDQIVQYRDVGTSLTLIPTVNHDGYVNITLLQEVSSATGETQFGAPVISTREASTRLLVRDRQTIVLGGLIDRQSEHIRTGIPLLKNIPLLGYLFGSTTRADFRTELYLFLTPHVLGSDEDVQELQERLERGSPLLRRIMPEHRTILPDSGGVRER